MVIWSTSERYKYRIMNIIEKKTWPPMFEGDRNLDIDFRLADFDLQDGDQIRFREWDPAIQEYTGNEYTKTVKRVTKHNSPTKYWSTKELEQRGMFIIEFK